jgi:RNA polymerase sigma factor (TIGR02999 family)
MHSTDDVTALLDDWNRGNQGAFERLLPIVYGELRRIAARRLRQERAGHTLQPTALVHETYLRLVDQRNVGWQSRAHFFSVVAKVMRRVLVDHARRRARQKRGDGAQLLRLEDAADTIAPVEIPVLSLHQALLRLEELDCGLAQIVELRAFGGLTIQEAAHVLKVSPATLKRNWRVAKAWLARELGVQGASEPRREEQA